MFDVVVHHQVTAQDKDLLIAVKDIIREDCKREKCKYSSSINILIIFLIHLCGNVLCKAVINS